MEAIKELLRKSFLCTQKLGFQELSVSQEKALMIAS